MWRFQCFEIFKPQEAKTQQGPVRSTTVVSVLFLSARKEEKLTCSLFSFFLFRFKEEERAEEPTRRHPPTLQLNLDDGKVEIKPHDL